MINKNVRIRIYIALFFFIFILTAHFYLTDYSNYIKQIQWIDLPVSSPFNNYLNNQNIFLGYSYAISGAFAILCLINLITATGNLNNSIKSISISAVLWLGICFMAGCCGSPMLTVYLSVFGTKIIGLAKPMVAGITTLSIVLSAYYLLRFKNKNILYANTENKDTTLSENPFKEIKIYKPAFILLRLIRYVLMTLFRLFPNPAPLGIYKFGNPDKNSPVLITSNYVLTLDRVAKALKNIDCYLLVVEGKGINVWCSAGAGHFKVESIVKAIYLSKIENIVNHKKIILPQFAAVGVCKYEVEKNTGWKCFFGPAYIDDIKEYLENGFKKTEKQKLAKFDLKQRVEMAVGCSLLSIFIITCIMVFINVNALVYLIPLIYLQAVIFAIFQPHIKIHYGLILGVIYSLIAGLLIILTNKIIFSFIQIDLNYIIPLMITGFYIPNEFLSWSPLIKYNWQVLLKGYWKADIKVDKKKCIGCKLCIDVCPVNVFEMINKKSNAVRIKQCEGCKACFIQCPVDAIEHSLKNENDSCACLYCNIQENISNK